MTLELLPCPFCGGKAAHKTSVYNKVGSYGHRLGVPDIQWHGYYCKSCLIGQPKRTYFSKEEVAEQWNKRV